MTFGVLPGAFLKLFATSTAQPMCLESTRKAPGSNPKVNNNYGPDPRLCGMHLSQCPPTAIFMLRRRQRCSSKRTHVQPMELRASASPSHVRAQSTNKQLPEFATRDSKRADCHRANMCPAHFGCLCCAFVIILFLVLGMALQSSLARSPRTQCKAVQARARAMRNITATSRESHHLKATRRRGA